MHNMIAVLLLATAPHPNVSISLSAPVDPALAQRRDAIAASLSPSAKLKLHNIAMSLPNSPAGITDGTSRSAIVSAFPGVKLNDSDVNSLVFVVMMENAESTRQDLKALADNLDAINKQKEALRHELGDAANRPPRIQKVQASTNAAALTIPPPLPRNATITEKQDRLGLLLELSKAMQMRLQMQQNVLSRFYETLANILKKMNDTNSSVIKNLK